MAASSLIRLLTALLMLTGLALSSSLAWAQQQDEWPAEPEYQEPAEQPADRPATDPRFDEPDETEPRADVEPMRPLARRTPAAWVITRNTLVGGVFGAAVGTAGYLISGQDWSPWNIAYFGAGGAGLGLTVGLIQVLTREDQPAVASLEWMERDMPTTIQIPVLDLDF
ncbi:MAG: hypothetical protein ACNA8W_00500 [Bradymonadaceae bacterium]